MAGLEQGIGSGIMLIGRLDNIYFESEEFEVW